MKAVVLVLACVAVAAALSVKSSPEARFMSTEEGMSSSMSAATVVSDRDYAALKHEEAEKAVQALHLPGDKPDLLTELGIDHNVAGDAEEEANDEELLALAAQTESTDSEDADAAETAEALESEIEAAEAEEDSADVLLEVAEEEEDEEEAEDEAEDESEEESEEEDAVFLEVADEDEEEAEDEDEEESEDEDEAEAEDEAEEEESEDLALIAESEEKPSRYISPVLRPALPSKHNDAMPDATYDKVAETNLFPPAAHLVGAGPKPKPFSPAEIAAADAKIRAARAKKAKSKKLAAKSRKAMKAPKPAAKGRKARKGGRKNRKVSRKQRKNRRGSRKARRGSRKGRRGSRKGRRGGKKGRRGSRKGRKARKSRRAGKKGGASKKNKNCKKPGDPRCIITPPYLQDIRDARHHHFIKTTNDLLNEVDDGILEHMVYPKIADPNKKGCKTKKAKKF